ncbi:hypothetical protein [Rubellimicrobium mesophilum]|uniref:hypothetical protein n=1 Tax=Rubellimicrobium mesophilum TaxID=1123067 RepID=UPI0012E1D18D|nr:hypothetical protein [Rubellimicrobium mesophilum]
MAFDHLLAGGAAIGFGENLFRDPDDASALVVRVALFRSDVLQLSRASMTCQPAGMAGQNKI